ncbi:MAG: hypothetical protein JWM10_176 [Myxococcaceae bacterium]|nr:hypothetical protein [Myxococcaceae bacterium]
MTRARRPPSDPTLSPAAIADLALKRDFERALKALEAASAAESEQWDAKWEAVGAIVDHEPPLFLSGGFRSVKAFSAKHLGSASLETIRTSVRVARHFDAAAEKRHGTAKLAVLLDCLEAAGGALPEAAIDPARTRVRVRRGRAFERVPFATLTFDELRAAARLARGKAGQRRNPPALAAVRQQLADHGFEKLSVRGTAARYDVLGIAYEDAAAVHRALAKVKLPKPTG